MQRSRKTGIFGYTVKPRGFMGIVAALFVATQILCCFHTHTPLHEDDHEPTHQTECDVCLIAHMPVDTGNAASDIKLPSDTEVIVVRVSGNVWGNSNPSLIHARAPPASLTNPYS